MFKVTQNQNGAVSWLVLLSGALIGLTIIAATIRWNIQYIRIQGDIVHLNQAFYINEVSAKKAWGALRLQRFNVDENQDYDITDIRTPAASCSGEELCKNLHQAYNSPFVDYEDTPGLPPSFSSGKVEFFQHPSEPEITRIRSSVRIRKTVFLENAVPGQPLPTGLERKLLLINLIAPVGAGLPDGIETLVAP